VCTVVTNAVATGATYTCTTGSDSRVSACATDGFYKIVGLDVDSSAVQPVSTATADVCSAVTAACGNQAPVEAANAVQRTQSSVATGTSDLVCQACTAGTFAAGPGDNCVACTGITGADATLNAVTYTCTSATDTRFASGGCAATSMTKKTVGATGVMTTCTAACGTGSWDNANTCTACAGGITNAAADATYTCTSAADSRISSCLANAFKTEGAAENPDTCTLCSLVTGAKAETTYTCTSAANSHIGSCVDGKFKTGGGVDAVDTCSDCTVAENAASVTCSTDGDSVAASCNAGFWLVSFCTSFTLILLLLL